MSGEAADWAADGRRRSTEAVAAVQRQIVSSWRPLVALIVHAIGGLEAIGGGSTVGDSAENYCRIGKTREQKTFVKVWERLNVCSAKMSKIHRGSQRKVLSAEIALKKAGYSEDQDLVSLNVSFGRSSDENLNTNACITEWSERSPTPCRASEPASNHLRATQGGRRGATGLQHWQEETRQVASQKMEKISVDRVFHSIDQPIVCFFYSLFKCIFCIVLCFHCFWKAGKANAFSAMTTIIFPVGHSGFLLIHFLKKGLPFILVLVALHKGTLSNSVLQISTYWRNGQQSFGLSRKLRWSIVERLQTEG